jgi:hypothetical protein
VSQADAFTRVGLGDTDDVSADRSNGRGDASLEREPLTTEEKFDVTPEVAATIDQGEGEPKRRSLLGFLSWIRTSD